MTTRKLVTKAIKQSSSTYIGKDGEIFYDTVTNSMRISDGATPGGTTLGTDGSGASSMSSLINGAASLALGSNGAVTFNDGTIQNTAYLEPNRTNHFFVDPQRSTQSYTPNGSILKPYLSITAAQSAIESLITAGTIVAGESNPIFIVLVGDTTENITLSRGHVFLTSLVGTIHQPIHLYGSITISGSNTTSGALDANHFSIQGIAINAPAQQACIYFTGSNAQRLFVKDLWLTATGNQTGTTPFTDAGGYGIYADCTGARVSPASNSIIHGSDLKISHNGTGDVYCFKIGNNGGTSHVSADFNSVETSGATQVGAVSSGCLLSFANSELDANGETCLEAYGTGSLVLANSLLSNAAAGVSYGIWLHSVGSNATVFNSVFSVASSNASSRAVHGITGTVFVYGAITIGKTSGGVDYNAKIDTAITRVPATVGLTAV